MSLMVEANIVFLVQRLAIFGRMMALSKKYLLKCLFFMYFKTSYKQLFSLSLCQVSWPKLLIKNIVNLLLLMVQPWKLCRQRKWPLQCKQNHDTFKRSTALWNSYFNIQCWLRFRINKNIRSKFCTDINFQLVKLVKYPDRFLGNFCL